MCFSALQYASLGGSSAKVTTVESALPAQHPAADLVKRIAIAFGDSTFNLSSALFEKPVAESKLFKRASAEDEPVTLTYKQGICKGESLRNLINRATTDGRTWTLKELESPAQGWLDLLGADPVDEDTWNDYPEAVKDALRNYGMTTPGDFLHRQAAAGPFARDGKSVSNLKITSN